MNSRIAILAGVALALAGCTTAIVASNPLQARWNGKTAGSFPIPIAIVPGHLSDDELDAMS